MGYIVNFISGPSVGKSLISALVYAELKLNGYTTEYVQEYAKQLVWLKKWDKLDNQYLVSTKQYSLIKVLDDIPSIEYVVVDGALVLGLYYNRHYKTNVSNLDKTEDMIMERNNEFKNIYIHLERNPSVEFEQEGRVQTYSESLEVDSELKRIMNVLGLPYRSWVSSKDSIPGIVEYIREQSERIE